MGPRWKGKGSEVKALANPMSRSILDLQRSLKKSNSKGILSGCSVLLACDPGHTYLLNLTCFGQPIITAKDNHDKDKQCTKIFGGDDSIKTYNELWDYMTSKNESFPDFFKAYYHLRDKNLVVRSGDQYGVLVLREGNANGNMNGNDDGYSVEERTITRWSPERRREDQALKSTRWSPKPPREDQALKTKNKQVLIRMRPLNNMEKIAQGYGRCLKQESLRTLAWLGHPEVRFTFDHIVCETISQAMKLFSMLDVIMKIWKLQGILTYENEDTHIFESVYATAYIPLSKRGTGHESKGYESTVVGNEAISKMKMQVLLEITRMMMNMTRNDNAHDEESDADYHSSDSHKYESDDEVDMSGA
ncbi:tRNA-splicing endonuclease subunit Sen2-1-like protein isoform X1 [Tanacetum coccineum]